MMLSPKSCKPRKSFWLFAPVGHHTQTEYSTCRIEIAHRHCLINLELKPTLAFLFMDISCLIACSCCSFSNHESQSSSSPPKNNSHCSHPARFEKFPPFFGNASINFEVIATYGDSSAFSPTTSTSQSPTFAQSNNADANCELSSMLTLHERGFFSLASPKERRPG